MEEGRQKSEDGKPKTVVEITKRVEILFNHKGHKGCHNTDCYRYHKVFKEKI